MTYKPTKAEVLECRQAQRLLEDMQYARYSDEAEDNAMGTVIDFLKEFSEGKRPKI